MRFPKARTLGLVGAGNSAPAPTLTTHYEVQGDAGGQSFTFAGTGYTTNPADVTVTVGGTAATVTASTATSITFTTPAKAASGTGYDVVATTAGGSATATACVFSLPSNVSRAWYAPDYNATAGTWVDRIASAQVDSATTGMAKPTKTASWTNGQAGVTGTIATGLGNSSTPNTLAQPGSIFFVGNATSNIANALMFDGVHTSDQWAAYNPAGASATISLYAGGVFTSGVAIDATPALYECLFNGASSAVAKNNGSPVTGNPGAWPLKGTYIGCNADASVGWPGSFGLFLVYGGAPSAGDKAIIHTIAQAIYGIS